MEINKIHIVRVQDSGLEKRFAKVYECNGRYFLQVATGAIQEITKERFGELLTLTDK